MSDPPPGEDEGAADVGASTAPDRASSLGTGAGNSGRQYALFLPAVNAPEADAETRASEARAAPAPDAAVSSAERVFLEICRERTGRELPPESAEEANEARRLLLAQSYRIADALEAEGIRAYGPSKLTLVGVCSGAVVELPDFRNIVFIPSVAQRKRHRMLQHLEYYLQDYPFSRMWVFTSGDRVRLDGVRDRIERLHRRLSKLNAEPFMKAAGAELVFRSTELGEVERDESGAPTFHVHAHAIVRLREKLSPELWTWLLGAVRGWWKHHFKDSQRIHQAREACKYVVKPGDLDRLTGPELAMLHRQLFRLHLVQCLGLLKERRRKEEEGNRKLVRRGEGDASRWELVENWNEKRGRRDPEEGAPSVGGELKDWVVCTLPPSFALSPRAEPLAVVLNFTGTGDCLADHRKLARLREACLPLFHGEATPDTGEKGITLFPPEKGHRPA